MILTSLLYAFVVHLVRSLASSCSLELYAGYNFVMNTIILNFQVIETIIGQCAPYAFDGC